MDLLRRFANGDIDAFETLARQIQDRLYAWIVRMVRDPGSAEDLTVEALWRMYRSRHTFRPDGNFEAWARRIATNLAIDYLRRKRPEEELLTEPAAAPAADPIVGRETQMKIRQAFRKLPPKLQAAATLSLIEELPYQETAAALGISVTAAKLRVFRAVRMLRKQLGDLGIRPASEVTR